MGLNVAQLNIIVNADTGPTATALQQIPVLFAGVAQASAAAASQEVAANGQVLAAIETQTQAIANQTQTVIAMSQQQVTALEKVAATAKITGSTVGQGGITASQGLGLMNQALYTTGGAAGPLPQILNLVGSSINTINQAGSTGQGIALGFAAGLVAVGAAAAGIASPIKNAEANVKASLTAVGKDWYDYSAAVQQAINKNEGYGRTAAETQNSLAQFARVTNDAAQMLQAEQVAADVAATRHITLAAATDLVTRAMEGNARAIRVLGVEIQDLLVNPAQKLTDAMQHQAQLTTQMNSAIEDAAAAEQRYKDTLAEHALKANEVAKANETLLRSQQNLADVNARIAAEDLVPHLSEQAKATRTLADAYEHLDDVQRKQAAEAAEPVIDKVAEATDRLTLAQLRLNDANDSQKKASTITPEDLSKLADASDRVLRSQMALAQAQGSDIIGAQDQLRGAVDAQRKALDAANEKMRQAGVMSTEQVAGQIAVKQATQDLANAQTEAANRDAGNTTKQIQNAINLRDAIRDVNDAQAAYPVAVQKDQADAMLLQLQRARDVREATQQITDAQEGVAQASRNVQIQALQERDAHLAVEAAWRRVHAAVDDYVKGLGDVGTALNAVFNQHGQVLDAIHDKTKGIADDMKDKGLAAVYRHWKAVALDTIGETIGSFAGMISTLGGLAFGVTLLAKPFGGIWGAIKGGSKEAADAVEGVAGEVESLGEGAVAVGEDVIPGAFEGLGALIAPEFVAIAAAGKRAYDDLTDKNSIFRQTMASTWDDVSNWAKTGWHGVQNAAKSAWDGISSIFGHDDHKKKAHDDGVAVGQKHAEGLSDGYTQYVKPEVAKWKNGVQAAIPTGTGGTQSWLYNAGMDAAYGFYSGYYDQMSQLETAVYDATYNMAVVARKALKVTSPSKVFMEIGKYTMDGLVQGIRDNQFLPAQAIGIVADNMTDIQRKKIGDMLKLITDPGAVTNGLLDFGSSVDRDLARLSNSAFQGANQGGTTIVQLSPYVAGSLVTERDLMTTMKDLMIEAGRSQGGLLGGGEF